MTHVRHVATEQTIADIGKIVALVKEAKALAAARGLKGIEIATTDCITQIQYERTKVRHRVNTALKGAT